MEDFGIILFGHSRPLHIAEVLESLKRQNATNNVHVWLDGHQGNPEKKIITEQVAEVVSHYDVASMHCHKGNLGFRKLVLQALSHASQHFHYILVLEDDCFPTKDAVTTFRQELKGIENKSNIFSIYGHHFLTESENDTCSRFQGWGWGTTSTKLKPILNELIECYSLTEERYLEFVKHSLTPEIIARLDVTPPRLPTHTLRKFFAWDETIALLTALRGWEHKKTTKRTIYNFGVGETAGHFKNIDWYRKPPFNMIEMSDVWNHF